MAIFTVLLTNDVVGTLDAQTVNVGDIVTVDLPNQNGQPSQATGKVIGILSESGAEPCNAIYKSVQGPWLQRQ
ncbi:hypothetical protein [Azomonas macrocytogenes]|uniref:Uncharacterized protein n=1 Tax=Azomonas macrocytogenes TaxID=69962 RepID=A0A839T2G1_AZOMA|nr:hypothetical protein [Azomonas macrocytogenes]MBB3102564.1 hypothetical protein [Azomonas macrocytogenes]